MITRMTIEIDVTHNGSCSSQDIADGLELHIEGENEHTQDEPDDFGITKVKVVGIITESYEPKDS